MTEEKSLGLQFSELALQGRCDKCQTQLQQVWAADKNDFCIHQIDYRKGEYVKQAEAVRFLCSKCLRG